jgi:hypothetical protein
LGTQVVQVGSLHSSVSWVTVGRRCWPGGRFFDDTEAVRDTRGRALSLTVWRCSPSAGFLALGAGLCEGIGAVVAGAAGGERAALMLGAVSALLFEAAVKLLYPLSLLRSMLGCIFSCARSGFSSGCEERLVEELAVGEALRGKFSILTRPSASSLK